MTQHTITMYTMTTCGHCRAAKEFLDRNSIPYSATDINLLQGEEREKKIAELRAVNPACTVPTILIGEKVIIGFNEEKLRQALSL